jgi:hypothetical protein
MVNPVSFFFKLPKRDREINNALKRSRFQPESGPIHYYPLCFSSHCISIIFNTHPPLLSISMDTRPSSSKICPHPVRGRTAINTQTDEEVLPPIRPSN